MSNSPAHLLFSFPPFLPPARSLPVSTHTFGRAPPTTGCTMSTSSPSGCARPRSATLRRAASVAGTAAGCPVWTRTSTRSTRTRSARGTSLGPMRAISILPGPRGSYTADGWVAPSRPPHQPAYRPGPPTLGCPLGPAFGSASGSAGHKNAPGRTDERCRLGCGEHASGTSIMG